ncbi:uncharacterized protein ATC70_003278 [Mucor velutinosus]|uniref:Uncharacterized protein n=1 Tax=Mucor velutinosus TaxID=708070 RepID=A0AAN7DBE4_9FUNG|nr:hypothetical protein ATC70_003278 [Mucor velutinosus]
MGRPKPHNFRINQLLSSVEGLAYDFEGPTANYLLDASHLYDQKVYENVHAIAKEWKLVDKSEALPYLPTRTDPLKVTLGIDEKKTTSISNGESLKLDERFKYKKGYVINTGGSIWGLDFAPKSHNDSDPITQYLAVAGYKGAVSEHHELNEIQMAGEYKNTIQIWKLKLSTKQPSEDPILDVCLLHDFGVIHDLKWCPYGAYEDEDVNEGLPKLGVLAITCGDGTLRTLVVPHPNAVRKHMCRDDVDPQATVYLRIESSRCTFALEGTKSLVISWGSHRKIAAGYINGAVVVWNMEAALEGDDSNTVEKSRKYLELSFNTLDASVRCITWRGFDDPDKLLVTGYDGRLAMLDINDPFIPFTLQRARGIMYACVWPGHSTMKVFCDGESMLRGISINVDGSLSQTKFGELPGVCWSMAASEHHGQFACSSAVGYVISGNIYQVKSRGLTNTTNGIYRLYYDEDNDEYRYVDGIGILNMPESKALPSFRIYGKTHMAIQKVAETCQFSTCNTNTGTHQGKLSFVGGLESK